MSKTHNTRLTLIGQGTRKGYGLYRCSCGTEKEIDNRSIKRGQTFSCGCLHREIIRSQKPTLTHGHACGGHSPTFKAWLHMRERCYDKKDKHYKDYGERGIAVCDRWKGEKDFINFLADMGEKPSREHSIDRKDNDGNYEPTNCRWATRNEQARNRRNNHIITFNGKSQCLAAWAEELGIKAPTIRRRLKRGRSIEEALKKC